MVSKEQILKSAVKRLNEDIFRKEKRQAPAPPPGRSYFTIPANDAGIYIQFHGFFERYLTPKSREILDFKNNPGTDVRLHNHAYFEITYLFSGSTTHHMLHGTVCQKPDTLILMNSYAVHGPVPDTDDTVMFNVCVRKEIFESIFSSMPSFNQTFYHFFLDSLYGAQCRKVYLNLKVTPEIDNVITKMLYENYQNRSCCQQKMYALLILLFSSITRQQLTDAGQDLEAHASIDKLLEKIRLNYTDITLEDLSRMSGYSKWHLSRMIKKNTGTSFREYLTSCKMENACNYRVRSGFSVEKICELIGYANTGYFYQKFKAFYGCTPVQYRVQNALSEAEVN